MNPTHKALRDATAAQHDRVDAAFAGFDLADRASYRAFLMAHADVVLPLEAALDPVAGRIVTDWPERKRGHLLREDLAFLRDPNDRHPGEGRDPGSQGTSFLALDPGLRRDDGVAPDDAAIAGTLYVLEGSRLGGRFLARRLAAGFPRAYLDSNQSAAKWQQLLGLLDEALYDPQTLQTALTAADAVFAAFARSADHWLTKG